MEKLLKSLSSHALYGSHTKIKVSDNPTQWDSVAPSKNFTIIYILFGIKVFLLVTKHKPEATEQQRELQNDGSLSLVAPRSFKRRKTHYWRSPMLHMIPPHGTQVAKDDIPL